MTRHDWRSWFLLWAGVLAVISCALAWSKPYDQPIQPCAAPMAQAAK